MHAKNVECQAVEYEVVECEAVKCRAMECQIKKYDKSRARHLITMFF